MTSGEIVSAWLLNKKPFRTADLKPVGHYATGTVTYATYECPCGCGNLAIRPYVPEGLSQALADILTCPHTGAQWYRDDPCIADVIREEEERYLSLLADAERVVRKVVRKRGWSEETISYLKDTHGIDRETAEAFRE